MFLRQVIVMVWGNQVVALRYRFQELLYLH